VDVGWHGCSLLFAPLWSPSRWSFSLDTGSLAI